MCSLQVRASSHWDRQRARRSLLTDTILCRQAVCCRPRKQRQTRHPMKRKSHPAHTRTATPTQSVRTRSAWTRPPTRKATNGRTALRCNLMTTRVTIAVCCGRGSHNIFVANHGWHNRPCPFIQSATVTAPAIAEADGQDKRCPSHFPSRARSIRRSRGKSARISCVSHAMKACTVALVRSPLRHTTK